MTPNTTNYVARLRGELLQRFIVDGRILDEVRDHLADATEAARTRGVSQAAAEAEAIDRFGPPDVVATALAADRLRARHRMLLVAAVAAGLLIAGIDARPQWDDAGVTAGAMVVAAAAFGLAGPLHPWRWGLAVGLWIPTFALLRTWSFGAVSTLPVLLFPLAGAWVGRAFRSVALRARSGAAM